jgi:hypothetical protein
MAIRFCGECLCMTSVRWNEHTLYRRAYTHICPQSSSSTHLSNWDIIIGKSVARYTRHRQDNTKDKTGSVWSILNGPSSQWSKGALTRSQQRVDDDDNNNNNNKNVAVEPTALVLSMWEMRGSVLASRIGYSGVQWFSSASFNFRYSELRLFPSTNFLIRY